MAGHMGEFGHTQKGRERGITTQRRRGAEAQRLISSDRHLIDMTEIS